MAGLRPVAEAAFPRAGDGYLDVLAGEKRLCTLSALALLRTPEGTLGGMLSYVVDEWAGRRGFYASGALLYPEEQGGGLVSDGYAMLMRDELLRAPLRALFAVVRTPNPVVYAQWERGIRLTGGHVDPRPGAVVPGYVRDLARALAIDQGFGDGFDPEHLIARGCYDGGVVGGGVGPYDVRPTCGNRELDDWFAARLGAQDAMLLVARLSLHRVAAIVGDRVLRRRLGRIGRHARREAGDEQTLTGPRAAEPRAFDA